MRFETQRLILRPWQPSQDARHAMDIYGDSQVMKWIDATAIDTSLRQVQGRLQRYVDSPSDKIIGSWAVEQKDIGRVIGHVLLMPLPDLENTRPKPNEWADIRSKRAEHIEIQYLDGMPTHYVEIGWHFRPASWGFGYATEAAKRVCQVAFEQLALSVLLAVTDPKNVRSQAVMHRLGMIPDGLTTRYYGGQPLLLYKLYPVKTQAIGEIRPATAKFRSN